MDGRVTYNVTLQSKIALPPGSKAIQYYLAAANATEGVDARVLALNDGPPLVIGEGTALPDLSGRVVPARGGLIVAAPYSIGFVVYPDAGAAACMGVRK